MKYIIASLKMYDAFAKLINIDLIKDRKKCEFQIFNNEPDLANYVVTMCKKHPEVNAITLDKDGLFVSMYLTKNNIVTARVDDSYSAYMTKQHNNAQVLALGCRFSGPSIFRALIHEFLNNT